MLYNWRQGGHTDRQTSQYYNAKDYSLTELQWSIGSTYTCMFQALTVMKTSCVLTLMWQINIFFFLRKADLNFLVLLNQYHYVFCQEIKHPYVNSDYTTFNSAPPKVVWHSQNILLLGL